MNAESMKGMLQRIGGRIEESVGTLVHDKGLRIAGQEDQMRGVVREAKGRAMDATKAMAEDADGQPPMIPPRLM